jgi:hypothetical protein
MTASLSGTIFCSIHLMLIFPFRYIFRPWSSWSWTYTGCSAKARTVSTQQCIDDFVYNSNIHVYDHFIVSFAFSCFCGTFFEFRCAFDSCYCWLNSSNLDSFHASQSKPQFFFIINAISWFSLSLMQHRGNAVF